MYKAKSEIPHRSGYTLHWTRESPFLSIWLSNIFSHPFDGMCIAANHSVLADWKVFTGLVMKFGEYSPTDCHVYCWNAVIKFFNKKTYS